MTIVSKCVFAAYTYQDKVFMDVIASFSNFKTCSKNMLKGKVEVIGGILLICGSLKTSWQQ